MKASPFHRQDGIGLSSSSESDLSKISDVVKKNTKDQDDLAFKS